MPLKVELHAHTSDDPADRIPHTAHELIDRAAVLGYHALAITLHGKQLAVEPLLSHAASRGIVLIPGVEATIEGRHVLLLNFSARAETVRSFDALERLRQDEPGLVVAPHPFFLLGSCVGSVLTRRPDLFDAVEVNAMHTGWVDLNRTAVRWARRHGKPLVGNGDVHRLDQLGTTYSLVDAEADPTAICHAIRAGRVDVRSKPMSLLRAARMLVDIAATPPQTPGAP